MNRLALLLLLIAGCRIDFGNLPSPSPPQATITDAARSGFVVYKASLANAFDTLASEVEQGAIEDDEDLANRMEELTKAARIEAFKLFRESWNAEAGPDSEWEYKQRAKLCREAAEGFRK